MTPGPGDKPGADQLDSSVKTRLRETFARSRDVVIRAHERAQQAVDRAGRIREVLRAERGVLESHPAQQEARRRVRLQQLAIEEGARSLHEKDRFLATVSHELRQPLNAALAALRIVELGGSASGNACSVLRRQLLQMARLVDDLLDLSRVSLDVMDMRLGHVDLRMVVHDAVATVQEEAVAHALTLEQVPLPDGICVWADEWRLRQVFSNLLVNAIKYTPAGGRISVSAGVERTKVAVTVADTGQGIAADVLPRIFDPFTRGEAGSADGFGIGLALVRAIVELHRGSAEASSPGPGQGSAFTVRLPRCPHAAATGPVDS